MKRMSEQTSTNNPSDGDASCCQKKFKDALPEEADSVLVGCCTNAEITPNVKKPSDASPTDDVGDCREESTSSSATSNGLTSDSRPVGSCTSAKSDECVSFSVIFGKGRHTLTERLDETVENLKNVVAKLTGVPSPMQKLMYKGMLKDNLTLRDCKFVNGCKIMLVGSTPTQVAAVNIAPNQQELHQAETQVVLQEPLCKQKIHSKVLEKGMPDDLMPGIKNVKDALPTYPITGLINKAGHKVRLTFKLELDQLWLSTKESTQKIPMSNIKNVVSEPVEAHEEYHIMGLQLGPTEASRYWLYWVPAQFVDAVKEAIMGGP